MKTHKWAQATDVATSIQLDSYEMRHCMTCTAYQLRRIGKKNWFYIDGPPRVATIEWTPANKTPDKGDCDISVVRSVMKS